MKQKAKSFTLVMMVFGLGACSGGRPRAGSSQCPKNFNPIPMEIPVQHKARVQSTAFADGEYVMGRSWLFFKGDPTPGHPEGFQVMVKNDVPERSKATNFVPRSTCFRNAAVTKSYSAKASAITNLKVEGGRVVATNAQAFGFEMDELGKFKIIAGEAEAQSKAVDELFTESSETFVVHYSDSLHEIRTKARGENGEWTMSTVLHRR